MYCITADPIALADTDGLVLTSVYKRNAAVKRQGELCSTNVAGGELIFGDLQSCSFTV